MSRTSIVTGGGTGIGFAVARALAARGDCVVITGRRQEVLREAIERIEGEVHALAFDAAEPAEVERAARELPERIDVLVNNAGGNTDITVGWPGPSLRELAAAWERNLRANLLSAVLVTSALESRLGDGGRIVNLSSLTAHVGSGGSYGAAKAAVEAWTRELARRVAPRGITANVVAPGFTESTEFFRDVLTPELRSQILGHTLTGRAGTPDEIAALVVFLGSAEAGQITGQVLHVNGGAHGGR